MILSFWTLNSVLHSLPPFPPPLSRTLVIFLLLCVFPFHILLLNFSCTFSFSHPCLSPYFIHIERHFSLSFSSSFVATYYAASAPVLTTKHLPFYTITQQLFLSLARCHSPLPINHRVQPPRVSWESVSAPLYQVSQTARCCSFTPARLIAC